MVMKRTTEECQIYCFTFALVVVAKDQSENSFKIVTFSHQVYKHTLTFNWLSIFNSSIEAFEC
jgi:hypothetical protein